MIDQDTIDRMTDAFQAETNRQIALFEPQVRQWLLDYAATEPAYTAGAPALVRALGIIIGRWIGETASPTIPTEIAMTLAQWAVREGVELAGQRPPGKPN